MIVHRHGCPGRATGEADLLAVIPTADQGWVTTEDVADLLDAAGRPLPRGPEGEPLWCCCRLRTALRSLRRAGSLRTLPGAEPVQWSRTRGSARRAA